MQKLKVAHVHQEILSDPLPFAVIFSGGGLVQLLCALVFFKWLHASSTLMCWSLKLLVQPVGLLHFDQDQRIICLRLEIGSLGILCTGKFFKTRGVWFWGVFFFVGFFSPFHFFLVVVLQQQTLVIVAYIWQSGNTVFQCKLPFYQGAGQFSIVLFS